MARSLRVWLGSRRVGMVTNEQGDYNRLSFDEDYLEDDRRPTLSQAFIAAGGQPVRLVPRTHRVAPPFFANLLPEEGALLRSLVARQYAINRTRDFPFLRVLGRDLPGAVIVDDLDVGAEDRAPLEPTLAPNERPLRFSLAGVQLKFSAGIQGNRVTIPLDGTGGSWIAKLPTNAFPMLPRNEHTIMSLARAIGLPVPETTLVGLDAIDGLPSDLPALRADEPREAYLIARFDRRRDGERIHAEDFNQIADQPPDEKYDRRSSSWVGKVVATICPLPDVDDFVRRLVFGVCIGNNDMHLKNWSIVYPDGRNARLAPMYDFVCTREYFPHGELALTIGGERAFERIGQEQLRAFAQLAEISPRRTLVLADEVVAAVREAWARTAPSIEDAPLRSAVERHFSRVPLMNAG